MTFLIFSKKLTPTLLIYYKRIKLKPKSFVDDFREKAVIGSVFFKLSAIKISNSTRIRFLHPHIGFFD